MKKITVIILALLLPVSTAHADTIPGQRAHAAAINLTMGRVIAGNGATTPVTLLEKFSQIVDVLQYGVVADGVTNNINAAQSVVNNNQKSSIYFPLSGNNNYAMAG